MKLKNKTEIGTMTLLAIVLSSSLALAANGEFGKMSGDEFRKANADAGMNVESIKPDAGPLSEKDKELLREVAFGGMMQIELSRAATLLGSSEDIKTIANAEIAEQSALATKLNEMATAGGATLPEALNSEATAIVDNLKKQTGIAVDKMYLQASGVEGHEKLKATMEKVQKEAKSAALRALGEAAIPLIITHLQVAKDELAELK
jgi:putative membrane protein